VVVVDVPVNGAVSAAPLLLSGSVSDDTGVDRVRVLLFDRDTSMWWNGLGWQAGFTWVDATLDNPGATASGWSYLFAPPSLSSQPYWFEVRPFDVADKFGNPISGGFTLQ